MPMKNRRHPGETLFHDSMANLGFSIAQTAKHLGVSSEELAAVVNGKAGISPGVVRSALQSLRRQFVNLAPTTDVP